MLLLVEPRPGKPGKFRLIHECRLLNELLEKWPFRMDNLRGCAKQTGRLDRLFTIDIAPAYHHIEIAACHSTMPGFHNGAVDYVYNCLPFGLGTSACVFCGFSAVTAEPLWCSGLVSALTAYDGDFGGSVGPVRDLARAGAIVRHIESLCWTIAPGKNMPSLPHRPNFYGPC